MSESENGNEDRKSSTALAVFVTCVLLALMSVALVWDHNSQIAQTHYVIPDFLIDIFVTSCKIAVGASAGATGIAIATTVIKAIENRKKNDDDPEPPKINSNP